MKKARALKRGDTIGIAASASPFDRQRFTKGIGVLKKMGFDILYRHDIFDQNRYLAGTDDRRAEEFEELMTNRHVAAIMFARGGYGSQRVIPKLHADTLRNNSKPVIGFSDITAMLTYLRQDVGAPTFYGPVITQLGRIKGASTGECLLKALTSPEPLGQVPMGDAFAIKAGSASGPIVGGCLSLINSSIGTPYELKTSGSILFIEEVGEKVYVLDRMLTQLKNSRMLKGVKGIVFGSIIPPEDEPHDVEAMIRDVLGDFDGPVVGNFPAGHAGEFVTLPLGANARLTAQENTAPTLEYTAGLLS